MERMFGTVLLISFYSVSIFFLIRAFFRTTPEEKKMYPYRRLAYVIWASFLLFVIGVVLSDIHPR